MKNIKLYLLLPVIALLASACNKYLDVQPKGRQVLNTTTDYDEWLNQPNLYELRATSEINSMTDYYDNQSLDSTSIAYYTLIQMWKPSAGLTIAQSGPDWGLFYTNISSENTVIDNIDRATGDPAQKTQLKAEALLGRAYEYLYLVNLYGREYDPATAAQDPAVPYVVSDDISIPIPPRSTVKDVYEHIISDINAAIPNLPVDNVKNRYRGSLFAAYSVLARTYFYMRDYPDAQKYAQMALQDPSLAMFDYNTPGATGATAYPVFPPMQIRSDVIYARLPYTGQNLSSAVNITCTPSLNFMNSFNAADLRLNLMKNLNKSTLTRTGATRGSIVYWLVRGSTYTQNTGTGVAEMKLIIAEAAARANDLSTALAQVNDLRKYRFPPAQYQALASADQPTVLGWVLRERGFELPFNGLRWLDMRRLDTEGVNTTYYRYDGANHVISTLAPHSNGYVLQIPYSTIVFHSDWQQNP